jgi:uncharacterized protein (DUF58 family)
MLFVIALLLTGAGAFLSANNLLFLVFSSMLALLLVSGFISRLMLAGLELELLLPEHVSARDATPARLRLRNLKYLTPSFSIELSGRRDPAKDMPSILDHPVYFPLVPGRSFLEAPVTVTFPFRGRHHDNLFLLSTRFPFGFLRKSTGVTLHRETLVYPAMEATDEAERLLDRVTGEIEAHQRGSGYDFYRIRPYEVSDSARLVDWKSTAHTGELQVREFSREDDATVEIFFDRRTNSTQGSMERFERAVSLCAFLAWNLTERDAALVFHAQGSNAMDDVHSILRYLATAEPLIGVAVREEQIERPLHSDAVSLAITSRGDLFERSGWNLMEP